MNNENKELLNNDVEINVSEEEIVLAPPVELFDEAKEIAQSTLSDEKFPFSLQCDSNQKEFLLSILETVGAIVEDDDDDGHILATMMNMTQLAFIKRLNCIEGVKHETLHNPFLFDNPNKPIAKPISISAQAKVIGETFENKNVSESNVAAATVTASPRSSCGSDSHCSSCSSCTCNKCMSDAKEILDESRTNGCIRCPETEQWFKFTATKSKEYTIMTTGSADTVGILYDCCGNEIARNDDNGFNGTFNFKIVHYLTAGCTYYVKVRLYGYATGSYTLFVTPKIYANYVNINKSTITLEKGVTYELPITPNYTYKGYNGAQRIPGLSVSISPSNANEQKIWWWEQYGSILECSYGWDEDGDRYIHVTATEIGTAKLYAQDWNENGKSDECTISINSTDPFDPSNVEYVRIKKWRSMKTTNGITYTECDMSTSVTKSYIDDLTYFTVFFPDEDQITTFEINHTLISQLNDIESQYQSQFFKQGRPLCFHKGKKYADIFVSEEKIEYASPEYYGIWAYNGNSVCEINDRLSFAYALASIAYSGFRYGFTKIMSMQSMQMTSGQTKTYTNSQYIDAVESQKAIADISDDVAIQLGKTDISSTSTVRRTWRASEMKVAEYYPTSSGYEYNKSYKIVGGKLTTVPHGTAGSQRPDFYNPSTNHIVEVKNYTITTSTGRNSLANNIAMQYNSRRTMFPDANIEFIVDVAGQSYTQSMLDEIIDLVSTLTGEDIVRFIYN